MLRQRLIIDTNPLDCRIPSPDPTADLHRRKVQPRSGFPERRDGEGNDPVAEG